MTENIFEQAAIKQLRFETPKGTLSVEDLYSLPLTTSKTNLNEIGNKLMDEVNNSRINNDLVSQLSGKEVKNEEVALNRLRLDIVVHIIKWRLDRDLERKNAEDNRRKKARIMEIINQKEDQVLLEKDINELKEML